MFSFVVAGFTAALASVLMAARLNSGSPNYGVGMELSAIAASVIGGASLSGGKADVKATLIGSLTIVVIQNGLNLHAVPASLQSVITGLLLFLQYSWICGELNWEVFLACSHQNGHACGGKKLMAKLYGRDLSKTELMKRIGDISQVACAKEYMMTSGKADGVRAIDVKTGTGLGFTVLPSRGMDIAYADYKGRAISFISKTGIVSPNFYDPDGNEFLRSFYGGLLTTCGLGNIGRACEDKGKKLGLHGRISNIPASDVGVYNEWEEDEFIIKIRGKMTESIVYGENLTLTRQISTKLGSNVILIEDKVENCGYNDQPLMLLYHCNFGYPIVSESSSLLSSESSVVGRDETAQSKVDNFDKIEGPIHDHPETVFFHDLSPDDDNMVFAGIYNDELNTGVYLKFNKDMLPYMNHWKQTGEGDYVVALEPATWYPNGRKEARERDELMYIAPGEIKHFRLEIGVVDDKSLFGEL